MTSIKETTATSGIAQTSSGLTGYLDADPIKPVKYYPGESKKVFLQRCIKNETDKNIELSYFDINLPMSHATFQHHNLSANGRPGDSTILYLVSQEPLKKSLYPWTYYQDLKLEAEEKVRADKEREDEAAKKKRKYGPH